MSSSSETSTKRQRSGTQVFTSTRSKLNEQLSKLQSKHNAEVELLEDMKQFTRQRSALEKHYSESMRRLVSQFSGKREVHPVPNLQDFERHNNRGLIEVWKALLEKTDELAKRRLTISELLLSQVSDVAKQQKRIKEANFKKLIEILQKMNSEVLESSKELTSSKKMYGDLEKVCEEARAKHTEAETRLKKKDLKFFESVSSLEKTHNKASERLKSCQKRTTVSRNDYLLAVATTNTHLKSHGTKDLPQIMQAMDGEMYDKVRNAYGMYARIEADAAIFIKAEYEDLAEQAHLMNRDYVLQCFLHQNPVVGEVQKVNFEPFGQDTVTAISRDHDAEIFLDKDARKWANKLTKDKAAVQALQKQVKGLQSVTSAYTKNPEFGTSDAQAEALQQTELLLEEMRQLKVQTAKAEARLDGLREAGIDVNKWLQKAEQTQTQSNNNDSNKVSASELTPSHSLGRVSQLSLPSSIGSSQDFDVETSSVNSAQLGGDDTASMGSGKSTEAQPKYCTVLYNYSAQRVDELEIVENDSLEVLEWDDGDGWCKGRDKSGREGYFPQSYVQPASRPASPGASVASSSLDFDTSTPTQRAPPSPQVNGLATKGKVLLKAVYDYTAQYDEELSFPEGATIELLRTDENGVDDGWWEGSYQGKVGVFPSLVVEIQEDVGFSDLDSTLVVDSTLHLPPLDSPPPLPPDYPPPPISPIGLNGGVGPGPTAFPDQFQDQIRTPVNADPQNTWSRDDLGDRDSWKMDSFDSD